MYHRRRETSFQVLLFGALVLCVILLFLLAFRALLALNGFLAFNDLLAWDA